MSQSFSPGTDRKMGHIATVGVVGVGLPPASDLRPSGRVRRCPCGETRKADTEPQPKAGNIVTEDPLHQTALGPPWTSRERQEPLRRRVPRVLSLTEVEKNFLSVCLKAPLIDSVTG